MLVTHVKLAAAAVMAVGVAVTGAVSRASQRTGASEWSSPRSRLKPQVPPEPFHRSSLRRNGAGSPGNNWQSDAWPSTAPRSSRRSSPRW